MDNLQINRDPGVLAKFDTYPDKVRSKMDQLRELILETASKLESVKTLEETLKWGEPSYLAKKGSTIRMDWKAKSPSQYAMYFSCSTSLVETFKAVYGNTFNYEKNRAIVFDLEQPIPIKELKGCISMALRYHSLKHLPFLGH